MGRRSTHGRYKGTVNCTILTIRSKNDMTMNQFSLFGAIFSLKQAAISVTFSSNNEANWQEIN